MKKLLLSLFIISLSWSADYIIKPTYKSVDETAMELQKILESNGFTIFGLVDHSLNARSVGMKLNDSKLLIFGKPTGGTKMMLKDPKVGYDLPLKVLIYSEENQTFVYYKNPFLLSKEYHLGNCEALDAIAKGLDKLTDAALQ
jgi:uncharacterized protein (DUF302 family)